jgi:hypothetical protein
MTGRRQAFVAYNQLHLAPMGTSPVLDPSQPLGLAQAVDHQSLIILTGISMGPVWITVGSAGEPGAADIDWEERIDVTLDITTDLVLSSPTIETHTTTTIFTPTAPGRHIVSVQARGRSARPDDTLAPDDDPPEEYLVTIAADNSSAAPLDQPQP